jgi:hypothetical protein
MVFTSRDYECVTMIVYVFSQSAPVIEVGYLHLCADLPNRPIVTNFHAEADEDVFADDDLA